VIPPAHSKAEAVKPMAMVVSRLDISHYQRPR
jgi:hypothetical protein